MIYQPKEPLIQYPPWSRNPLPSSRGLGRRCCCEECRRSCIGSRIPDEVQLTISGFTTNLCTQAECDLLNDVHVLSYAPTEFLPCRWEKEVTSDCALLEEANPLSVLIRPFFGVPTWRARIGPERYIGTPMTVESDCLTWSESLSHFFTGASFLACDGGEFLTVDIEAL